MTRTTAFDRHCSLQDRAVIPHSLFFKAIFRQSREEAEERKLFQTYTGYLMCFLCTVSKTEILVTSAPSKSQVKKNNLWFWKVTISEQVICSCLTFSAQVIQCVILTMHFEPLPPSSSIAIKIFHITTYRYHLELKSELELEWTRKTWGLLSCTNSSMNSIREIKHLIQLLLKQATWQLLPKLLKTLFYIQATHTCIYKNLTELAETLSTKE